MTTTKPASGEMAPIIADLRMHVRYQYMPMVARLAMERAADALEAQAREREHDKARITAAEAQFATVVQALATAKAEIATLKEDRAHEARKLDIAAFEAETNRMRAIQEAALLAKPEPAGSEMGDR